MKHAPAGERPGIRRILPGALGAALAALLLAACGGGASGGGAPAIYASDGYFVVSMSAPTSLPLPAFHPEGVPLKASLASPGQGSVVYDELTARFTYTPLPGAAGVDRFAFQLLTDDGTGILDSGTVTLRLSPPDVRAYYTIPSGGQGFSCDVPIPPGGSRSIDTTVDGGRLDMDLQFDTWVLATGELRVTADGRPFTVSLAFDGTAQADGTATGTVLTNFAGASLSLNLTVDPAAGVLRVTAAGDCWRTFERPLLADGEYANIAPTPLDPATLRTSFGTPIVDSLFFLVDDWDGGPAPFFEVLSGPSLGTLTLDDELTGAFTYTPANSLPGGDQFIFRYHDGAEWATVEVAVTLN